MSVAVRRDPARALVTAAGDDRLVAAVALLFVQGWRVSEVVGLAWADLDLDAGTTIVRRDAVYADGPPPGRPRPAGAPIGMTLGRLLERG